MRSLSRGSRPRRGLQLPALTMLPLLLLSCGGDGGSATPAGVTMSPTPGISLLAGAFGGPGNVDGTGASARFDQPLSVAADESGNLYVADTVNNAIRKIAPGGVVTTLAGMPGVAGTTDGTGSAARFNAPDGVAVDASGTVYVTDTKSATVRKITAGGVVTTLAGYPGDRRTVNGSVSDARFEVPVGIAVDSSGNIFVTDSAAHTVRMITPGGVVSTLAGNADTAAYLDGSGSGARFDGPTGIAVDAAGNLYVADSSNEVIRLVTPAGMVSTVAGVPGATGSNDADTAHAHFNNPAGIAVDAGGALYVTELVNHTVRKIDAGAVTTLAGLAGTSGSTDGNGSGARFNVPAGITFDSSSGQLFVADSNNNGIRAISMTADVTTYAGLPAEQSGVDGNGAAARFNAPQGLAVFPDGHLAVADTGNDTIRALTMAGDVTTLAGSAGVGGTADGAGSTARFLNPVGAAVDMAGTLYATDTGNYTIRKIASDGTVTTLAGTAGNSGSTDGAGATTALFAAPGGVAADAQGIVYVADTGNNVIRKITSSGVVSTLAGSATSQGAIDGTGSAASFAGPVGIAEALSGDLYVTDSDNNTIRHITPDGVVTTLAGSSTQPAGAVDGNGTAARFNSPRGIAVDGDGNLYVADAGNSLLRKITPSGDVSTLAGTAGSNGVILGALPGSLNQPLGVAVGEDGNLYVVSEGAVLRVTPNSPVSRFGVGLRASSTNLTVGQSATLTWASADSASCQASGDWSGTKALAGSETITPSTAGSTTYTLTCTQAGTSATKFASVTVAAVPPAPTASLSTSASHISPGDTVTLTWSSSNATSCTSSGAGWSGTQSAGGPFTVQLTPPQGLQAYSLTCTGDGGSATASTTVSVAFPPAVTLNASALTLSLGSSTTLTWSSSDTTSCTAAGAWSGNKAASGSQEVKPVTAGSQTYSLSCGGLNGYDTQSVVVTVRAPAAGSSGGGAAGVDMLLGLGLLGLMRRTLRRR